MEGANTSTDQQTRLDRQTCGSFSSRRALSSSRARKANHATPPPALWPPLRPWRCRRRATRTRRRAKRAAASRTPERIVSATTVYCLCRSLPSHGFPRSQHTLQLIAAHPATSTSITQLTRTSPHRNNHNHNNHNNRHMHTTSPHSTSRRQPEASKEARRRRAETRVVLPQPVPRLLREPLGRGGALQSAEEVRRCQEAEPGHDKVRRVRVLLRRKVPGGNR